MPKRKRRVEGLPMKQSHGVTGLAALALLKVYGQLPRAFRLYPAGGTMNEMLDNMPTFRWDERYSVNVALLDRQHQRLFDIFSELNAALAAGDGGSAMDSVLRQLTDYAKAHFVAEEALMELHRFPGLEAHRAEHEGFQQDLARYVEKFRTSKAGTSVSLLFYLQSWLKEHILKTDKDYSAFLNDCGVR